VVDDGALDVRGRTTSSDSGIIRCQAVVSSTLASALHSVVMTRVGHAIFGRSARMSAHAIVCMKPTWVETAVWPMNFVHHSTPSGGKSLPSRPPMLSRAQGSTPRFSKSAASAGPLSVLGEGDALVVTRLDRLGRSMRDLANIAHEIEQAGAHLKVIEQGVDTSSAAGRAFYGMLAVFAAFETDVRRERQLEGIAMARRQGAYKGGKPRLDRLRVEELSSRGLGPAAIARELGMARGVQSTGCSERQAPAGRVLRSPERHESSAIVSRISLRLWNLSTHVAE
jgi:DNA invertase Pin-like site-specific DNA recombinase